jgi:hypothetical protein
METIHLHSNMKAKVSKVEFNLIGTHAPHQPSNLSESKAETSVSPTKECYPQFKTSSKDEYKSTLMGFKEYDTPKNFKTGEVSATT